MMHQFYKIRIKCKGIPLHFVFTVVYLCLVTTQLTAQENKKDTLFKPETSERIFLLNQIAETTITKKDTVTLP